MPKPGWVEHNPQELVANSKQVMAEALDKAGITAAELVAIGITNQRETVVIWDKDSG